MSEIVRDKSDAHIESKPTKTKKKKPVPKWVDKLELTNLPRLPIPNLETTLQRYLEYVRPLLTPDEFAETTRKVKEFLEEDGPILDKQLHELAAESKTSWLEGFWNTMYLAWRDPVPIHINPCFVFEDDPTPLRNKMVLRAASLVYSTLGFIRLIHHGQLAGDFERDDPLCMSQYADLFGTTRVPQFGRDKLVTDYYSNHVAVVCRDQYYWFEITDQEKRPLEQEALEQIFHQIVEDATAEPDAEAPPLGMLTTTDRETWAGLYNKLIEIPGNKPLVEKLNSALFLVCLDPHIPSNLVETSEVMLHSDGRNRWFDKSIQLIICENGKAGINMEHSPFDGHTCLRFAEDVFNYSVRMRCDSPASFTSTTEIAPPVSIHRLNFQLTDEIVQAIDKATVAYQKFAGSLSTGILHYVQYGKSFLTKQSISPDAAVQIAFQIAQFRLSGKIGSTYESAMTKRFYHGRTECMRSVTNELASFLMTLADPSSTAIDQMKAIRVAAKAHTSRIALCKKGEGVDRHLYGLHNLAKQKQIRLPGYNIPDIFTDVAWGRLRYDVLSTSNCGGYSLSSFGFGPVVPDGFGIGYIIKDKCMHFHITNYDEKKTKKFTKLLEQSLLDIANLLVNGIPLRMEKKSKSKL